jgi:hypothetical protein
MKKNPLTDKKTHMKRTLLLIKNTHEKNPLTDKKTHMKRTLLLIKKRTQ